MRTCLPGLTILCAAVVGASPLGATEEPAPVRILFDSDMGSDCDDAGALALLHSYADEGRAEVIGCVYSSGKVPFGAAVMEAINVYYGRGDIPVGAAHDDVVGDPVDKMTAEKLARDRDAFGHRIVRNRDAPEQTRLSRRLLAAQPDGSVTYLTVGHTKGLHDLLVSEPDDISPLDGATLIARKVSRWVAMGAQGAANEDRHWRTDWNLCRNGSAPFTDVLLDRFPRPVVFVATGTDVLTGASLARTPPGNIVRTVYRDWLWNHEQKTLADQRPSWDLIAAFFAVEGRGDFLVDVGDGHLDFDRERGYRWEPRAAQDDHTVLVQQPGVSEELAAYLNERIARTPATRREP